jgi:hypothetical protein
VSSVVGVDTAREGLVELGPPQGGRPGREEGICEVHDRASGGGSVALASATWQCLFVV